MSIETKLSAKGTVINSYAELKNFLETLSEDQLKQKVRFWGEEEGKVLPSITVLQEAWVNPSGVGCEPISTYKDEYGYEDIEGEIVFPKGTVILQTEDMPINEIL